jgi:hypothetical protein
MVRRPKMRHCQASRGEPDEARDRSRPNLLFSEYRPAPVMNKVDSPAMMLMFLKKWISASTWSAPNRVHNGCPMDATTTV